MLSPKEMQEMDGHAVMHEVPEKQVIYLSDDEAYHVYILKKEKLKYPDFQKMAKRSF